MATFDLFSINSFGIGNPAKLLQILTHCHKLKKSHQFIVTIQETKIKSLKNKHINILNNFHLSFKFAPANNNRKGGLITVWSNNITHTNPNYNAYQEHTLLTTFEHNNTKHAIINTYLNTYQYSAALQELENNINMVPANHTLTVVGDFNAFSDVDYNSSKPILPRDRRIAHQALLDPLLLQHNLTDSALPSSVKHTHFDKQHQSFSRIDYIYTQMDTTNNTLHTHHTTYSDHFLLQLSSSEDSFFCRGTSYWKLNETILKPNRELITNIITQYNQESD